MNDIEKAIQEMCGHCVCVPGTTACKNAECSKRIYVDALREKTEQDNPKPLTLKELKERMGKPVWIEILSSMGDMKSEWAVYLKGDYFEIYTASTYSLYLDEPDDTDMYGKTWRAYDYKPKGGEKN